MPYNPVFMRKAIQCAEKARGTCSPNPFVGAVIVKEGKIISTGWTQHYGGDHAEIQALKKAGNEAKGAEIYVSLEPCAHYGKTPPCAEALVKAGVSTAYIGILDPNPLVAGKGIKILENSGIKVELGFMQQEISRQLEYFLCRMTKQRPFVIWKTAMSLDGRVAADDGSSRWITGDASRKLVHKLRSEVDVILTGIGTILKDDPLLNSRLPRRLRQPVRVVLDPLLDTPLDSQIVQTARQYQTLFFCTDCASKDSRAAIKDKGIELVVITCGDVILDLRKVLTELHNRGYYSVLLECGSTLSTAFLKAGLVDKAYLFYAPKLLGGSRTAVNDLGIRSIEGAMDYHFESFKRSGNDLLCIAYPKEI